MEKRAYYRYYSTQRPLSPGSYPKPQDNKVLKICNFADKTYCEEIAGFAWGHVDYELPISSTLQRDFELCAVVLDAVTYPVLFMQKGDTVVIRIPDFDVAVLAEPNNIQEVAIKTIQGIGSELRNKGMSMPTPTALQDIKVPNGVETILVPIFFEKLSSRL